MVRAGTGNLPSPSLRRSRPFYDRDLRLSALQGSQHSRAKTLRSYVRRPSLATRGGSQPGISFISKALNLLLFFSTGHVMGTGSVDVTISLLLNEGLTAWEVDDYL